VLPSLKAMRLAVTFPFENIELQAATRLVRQAEDLGYREAWSYERNVFDAFSPLAAAAMVTQRMRLGTSITPAFTRPPGLLAMSAASLAELAPGRFVLGVGASTPAIVSGWMGLEYGRPLTKVRETVQSVRALLAGEKVGGMRLHRPPPEPVPMYLAALGKRMLALAGEVADGVAFFMTSATAIPELVAGTGRALDSIARVVVPCAEDHEANLAFARRFIAGYVMVPCYGRLLVRQGFEAEVEAVRARWQAGDRHGAVAEVSEAMAAELMLLRTDPRLTERLEAFQRSGVGALDLWFISPAGEVEDQRRDVERALEVMAPALAAEFGR
jgi:probable F420-dependent oxidoreductase